MRHSSRVTAKATFLQPPESVVVATTPRKSPLAEKTSCAEIVIALMVRRREVIWLMMEHATHETRSSKPPWTRIRDLESDDPEVPQRALRRVQELRRPRRNLYARWTCPSLGRR